LCGGHQGASSDISPRCPLIRERNSGQRPGVVDATTPLVEAARLMGEHGTSVLIVVSGRWPVGVVSGPDIAAAIAWGGGG
jgi:CBS domain-containing protein